MQPFKEYLTEEEVQAGLLDKTLIKATFRVNKRDFNQCFVNNPDGEEFDDWLILGPEDRNRALHGDQVAVRLNGKEKWFLSKTLCTLHNVRQPSNTSPTGTPAEPQNKKLTLTNYHRVADLVAEDLRSVDERLFKKTAQVVAIIEKNASRKMVGNIKTRDNKKKGVVDLKHIWFSPIDTRIPRMLIPSNNAPIGFFDRPQDFEHFIYLAELVQWGVKSFFPIGKLHDNLGLAGSIETEHKALLLVNGIDLRDYDEHPALTECLPLPKNPGEWRIDPEELANRRDFREDVVFTIDPSSARDLDDALHIKRAKTKEGTDCWELGVHIADVSYFLKKGTELDDWACKRGTSVYLVHQVIPMLPRILCEEFCSLNPGVDRLTFSIVWLMDDEANILDTEFCRSVIRSCAKLSYEHAQDIIDNPTKQFAIAEMPPIHCGMKIRHIKQAVCDLDAFARKLKAKRFGEGALKLDLPKLRFDVNKSDTGIWQPRGIRLDERKEANFLVEEFMLLANMCVARKIHANFKKSALLRRHPPPKKKELKNLVDKCALLGIQINSLSSKTLADSLKAHEHREEYRYGVMPALNQMLMKCMHLAQYFCTGVVESETEFRHYALSVDFYTHFTSPIRRYPDVIVHRLLAACLGYAPPPNYSTDEMDKIASRANHTKSGAKVCSELSSEIFFAALVKGSEGRFETLGIVTAINDGCFDVLLVKYAITKRVYVKEHKKSVKRTYFGKLRVDGPLSLVLLLHNNKDSASSGSGDDTDGGSSSSSSSSSSDSEDDSRSTKSSVASSVMIENGADDAQLADMPGWLTSTGAEQLQTLRMMSIVSVRLVPNKKNAVKYHAFLVPTPDSQPLGWHDVKTHMDG